MRLLSEFPPERQPTHGTLFGDIDYEKVRQQSFFALHLEDKCYEGWGGKICVFFSAHFAAEEDPGFPHVGTIVVLGLCPLSRKDQYIDRIRRRYERYVLRRTK